MGMDETISSGITVKEYLSAIRDWHRLGSNLPFNAPENQFHLSSGLLVAEIMYALEDTGALNLVISNSEILVDHTKLLESIEEIRAKYFPADS